jgi:HlyD family secretion protein
MKFKLKKNWWWLSLVALAVIGVIWQTVFNKQPAVEYTTVKAVRGQLTQTVSETGTITPIDQLELNFLTPGKLAQITAAVGNKVKANDVLAKLDDTDNLIKARQAAADLTSAKAKLDKLLAGAASADIAVAQANEQAAQDNLTKTQASTAEAVAQAQKTYDDLTGASGVKSTYEQTYDNSADALLTALDNKLIIGVAALDAVKRITDDNDIKNYLSIQNTQALVDTKNTYTVANGALTAAGTKRPADSGDSIGLNAYYSSMISALNLVFKDSNYCFNALAYSTTAYDFSQATLDAYKATISGQSTTISAAISALQSAKQTVDNASVAWANAQLDAKNALATAQTAEDKQVSAASANLKTVTAQLNQVTAKARPEDIALAQATVQQAQAALDLINNQVVNDTIRAPIDGTISQVNYKVGEQSTAATPVIVMITQNHYEVDVDVAETDIAKIKINDQVDITLDAYGDAVKFTGQVIFIDPAETIIQGVTYYKVKIDFTPGDKEVKSGMTATADIKTATKDNVLAIPARAVIDTNGNKSVKVLKGQTAVDSQVQLGLSGDGGLVEVLSGVNEGDEVITYTKTNGQ